jgi:hypothetical protein
MRLLMKAIALSRQAVEAGSRHPRRSAPLSLKPQVPMSEPGAKQLMEAIEHFHKESDGITVWVPSELVQAVYQFLGESLEETVSGQIQPTQVEPRYKVVKPSPGQYANVVDSVAGLTVRSFNIFKGDGWHDADRYCARLNRGEKTPGNHGVA